MAQVLTNKRKFYMQAYQSEERNTQTGPMYSPMTGSFACNLSSQRKAVLQLAGQVLTNERKFCMNSNQ